MAETTTTYIDIPEAVGVVDGFERLQKAVCDPMIVGVGRYGIGVPGGIGDKRGAANWQAEDLADTPEAPRALPARRVDSPHREHYRKQRENGGNLPWMRVHDADRDRRAVKIVKEHSGKDVPVHDWSE